MRSRLRFPARLLAVAAVAAGLLVLAEPATAVTVPETLAGRRPVQPGPVEPGFPIDYVGVLWDEQDHADAHAHEDEGAEPHGAVRFRTDGVWSPWVALIEDGADGPGLWASGLVSGDDADAYQVRGVPADAGHPRAVAINTTDGPPVKVGEARGDAAGAIDGAKCLSRAQWGANEELRFDDQGNEIWPPEFYGVQALTVHHTATDNDDPDPAGTVRAIYRYHAVDQGWGDIGYQYLIDEQGVVYEGRWSGAESAPCASGSEGGTDFAHDANDLMVTGGHTGGYNSGNMGVALLGEFTDHPRFGADPKAAAVASLEDLLAELSSRHGLDPLGTVDYVNPHPDSTSTNTVDTISGHRDWTATECPGERLYQQLPTIRQNVAAKMGSSDGGGDDGGTTDPAPADVTVTGTTPGTLGVGPDQALTVSGTGFVDGATVAFENGKGHAPTITSTRWVSESQIDLTVTVEAKGPSGAWDVRVNLPDGRTASCTGCLTISR